MKNLLKEIIPKLSLNKHKGQDGRLCVIGGCKEYTGAPYFSAITVLRGGGDLSHVICDTNAANSIKSYGPEIIVEPLLNSSSNINNDNEHQALNDWIKHSLKRMHAVICGPGLGRNENMLHLTSKIIESSINYKIPMILDGDALWLLSQIKYRNIINHNQQNIILTPNAMEFRRLWINHVLKQDIHQKIDNKNQYLPPFDTHDLFEKLNLSNTSSSEQKDNDNMNGLKCDEILQCKNFNNIQHIKDTATLAQTLNGITILRKGAIDIITNGNEFILIDKPYSLRRCGGQGDILAGMVGLWQYWCCTLYNESGKNKNNVPMTITAAYAASYLMRNFAVEAFNKYKRSTLTTDMIACIPTVMDREFPIISSL